MKHSFLTKNEQQTMELAGKFALTLKGGEVIGLVGDLGGGKTTFTKGLAEALKVCETISSPTFVMLKKYPGKINDKKIELVHIDAYRVENLDDIISVGIEDYLNSPDTVMVVEWADKIAEILPADTKYLYFSASEDERKIEYD